MSADLVRKLNSKGVDALTPGELDAVRAYLDGASSGTKKAVRAPAPEDPPPVVATSKPPERTETTPEDYENKSWVDALAMAPGNIPHSAVETAKSMVAPIVHPVDTAVGLKDIALGLLQKVRNLSGEGQRGSAEAYSEEAADSVGKYLSDRYGSVAGRKRAIAEDPVGILTDLGGLLMGGGSLIRAGGKAATLGGRKLASMGADRAADRVASAIDTKDALRDLLVQREGLDPSRLNALKERGFPIETSALSPTTEATLAPYTAPASRGEQLSRIASKVAGATGRALTTAGDAAGAAGRSLDPVSLTSKVLLPVINPLLKHTAGRLSGAGPRAIEEASLAGERSVSRDPTARASAEVFTDNMRDRVPQTDVVDEAKAGYDAMRRAMQRQYLSGMKTVGESKKHLDFDAVEKSAADLAGVKKRGKIELNTSTQKVRDDVNAKLAEWRDEVDADPDLYLTPAAFDDLKHALSDIQNRIPLTDGASHRVVGGVIRAVRQQIIDEAPQYAKTMKNYENSKRLLDEASRETGVGAGNKRSAGLALKKLQVSMRNNAMSSWGYRQSMVDTLEQAGAKNLFPALAGQALNTWVPRGLSAQTSGPLAIAASMMTQPLLAAPAVGLSMPRLVGEGAYALGKVRGAGKRVPLTGAAARTAAYELGQATQDDEEPGYAQGGPVRKHVDRDAIVAIRKRLNALKMKRRE